MDIKQLRSFIAVANALSFSRAARQIHLSQPALSTQIQGLESQLGVQLLVRNRRTVRLTPSGESLLAEGHLLLQQISNIERRVASIGSGEVGHLRLGFVASATMPLIPAIALAFKKRYPGVSLELRNLPTTNQIEALRNGTIDAGFVRLPLAVNGLSIEGIHREPFAIVLAKSHRLARERNLTVQHLSGEPFVSYGRQWAPAFYDHWTEICRRAGFSPGVIQETAEMETALVLVAAGLGVAILPEGITRRRSSILKRKVLSSERIQSELGVATLKGSETPLLQHLISVSKQVGGR